MPVIQSRRTELTVKAYIGFEDDAVPFTSQAMADMDATDAQTNFKIVDRTKQYWSYFNPITVYNNGVAVAATGTPPVLPYTLQRLGGMVRYSAAQSGADTIVTTAPVLTTTATGGTLPAAKYWVAYTVTDASGDESNLSALSAGTTTTGATSILTVTSTITPPAGGTVRYYVGTGATAPATTALQFATTGTGGGADTITAPPALNAAAPPTLDAVTKISVSGKYIPMYFLSGAKNISTMDQSQEIDTTGSGDTYGTGTPARAKVTGSFSFIPGATVIDPSGNTVFLETKMYRAKRNNTPIYFVVQDDTSNVLLPRRAYMGFLGNLDVTRNLSQAVEIASTFYLAASPDTADPGVQLIDYSA